MGQGAKEDLRPDRDGDAGEGARAEPPASGLAADQGAGPIERHTFFSVELKIDHAEHFKICALFFMKCTCKL